MKTEPPNTGPRLQAGFAGIERAANYFDNNPGIIELSADITPTLRTLAAYYNDTQLDLRDAGLVSTFSSNPFTKKMWEAYRSGQ